MEFELPKEGVAFRSLGSDDSTVGFIPGSACHVRFNGDRSPFVMTYSACENPKCTCRNVIVGFIEETEDLKPAKPHFEFAVELDVDCWKVMKTHHANARVQPLIEEFLRHLNEDLQASIRTKYHTFRLAITQASEFRLSAAKIRKGTLVAASRVFGISRDPLGCSLSSSLMTEHEGAPYRIYDYYCMNPSCECNDTHLVVGRVDRSGAAEPQFFFSVRLTFGGKMQLKETCAECPEEKAVEFISEWLSAHPMAYVELQDRYERIKAVGKRLTEKRSPKRRP
jgi:hypothetical protein